MTREEKAQFCIDRQYKTPAFQMYPSDWFGSGHVSMMSAEQRGIHATLIFAAWPENNCGIPENDICSYARISCELKPIALSVLNLCWFLYQGFWFNERLLNERIKQIFLSDKRKLSGSKGGRPIESKIKRKKPIANQVKASETKSEEENEIEKEIENTIEIPIHLKEIWPKYLLMRKTIRKPATIDAEKGILKKLEKLAPGDNNTQIAIIQESINNSWQGVFELRQPNKNQSVQMEFQRKAVNKYANLPKASN